MSAAFALTPALLNRVYRAARHEALVVSADGGRLVTSGAATPGMTSSSTWAHATSARPPPRRRRASTSCSGTRDGQAPFNVFDPLAHHGHAAILDAQRWVAERHAVGGPVAEMQRLSGFAPRTFKRRFKAATGLTPIRYVQQIRVERAKRILEATAESVEAISWAVGYEDPAAFLRRFKRLTGVTPGEYRRRFRLPELPHLSDGRAQ